ncbi:hypothetical protein ACQPW1_00540 [Nocardia sp. CA-128927]|uniref:hypothetical protein n=1 Tax=Nocardia sp. CA-128927 TaxID=3239975 RepID=UPI003D9847B7
MREKHDAVVQTLDEVLDLEAGLAQTIGGRLAGFATGRTGEIATYRRNEIAPSVRQLLAEFNADTLEKMRIAPVDSRPTIHQSDGTLCEVDADGWVREPDEMDTPPVIDVEPISVLDIPTRPQLPPATSGVHTSPESRVPAHSTDSSGNSESGKESYMDSESKSATIELDDHPGVEYSVTITQPSPDSWVLSRVTVASRSGILTGWDLQPSAERLVYNVLYGIDMLFREPGEPPEHEFDWMDETSRNILIFNGIRTMAMLADKTDAQLLELRNMGSIRVGKLREGITKWQAKYAQQISGAGLRP